MGRRYRYGKSSRAVSQATLLLLAVLTGGGFLPPTQPASADEDIALREWRDWIKPYQRTAEESQRDVVLFLLQGPNQTQSPLKSKLLHDESLRRKLTQSVLWLLIDAREGIVDGSLPRRQLEWGTHTTRLQQSSKAADVPPIWTWLELQGTSQVVLVDRQGRPLAISEPHRDATGEAILQELVQLVGRRRERDRLFRLAQTAEGLARAKLLHRALRMIEPQWLTMFYREQMEEIILADAANDGGLRVPYELRLLRADVTAKALPAFVEKLNRLEREFKPQGSVLQELLFVKASLLYEIDREESRELFREAQAIDPTSSLGSRIESVLQRAFVDPSPMP